MFINILGINKAVVDIALQERTQLNISLGDDKRRPHIKKNPTRRNEDWY